jgi:hypothetical protein
MAAAELAECGQFAQICLALYADEPLNGVRPELGGAEQLEEELVAVGRPDERRLKPAFELRVSGAGEAIDDSVGPVGLRDDALGDERVALEPIEHLVEVTDVELAPLWPDRLLETGLQLIAVARAVGEEGEDGVVDRHDGSYRFP